MKKRLTVLAAIAFPVQIVLVKLLGYFPNLVERTYSLGLYKLVSGFLKVLTFWIPFSLGQWLFYASIIWMLYGFYKLLLKLKSHKTLRKFIVKNALINFVAICSIIYFFFNILWGINYSRNSLETSLNLAKIVPDNAKLKALAKHLIDETNSSRRKIGPIGDTTLVLDWKNRQYFEEATLAFQNLSNDYRVFSIYKPSVKAVAFPQLMSVFGIGGIFFPFTNEANVNMHQPDFKLPYTVCHEMAHQIGFGSEKEANFIAFLACRASNNTVFNYSGNLIAMRYALNALHKTDTLAFNELLIKLDKGVLLDLEANTLYWERYETFLDNFSSWMNDLFLKANGEKAGINSYGLALDLILADFEKNISKQKQKPIEKILETSKTIIPDPSFVAFCQAIPPISLPFNFTCESIELLPTPQIENYPFDLINFQLRGRLFLDEHKVVLLMAKNSENTAPKMVEYSLDGILQTEMLLYDQVLCNSETSKFVGQILSNLQVEIETQKINCQTINNLEVCDTISNREQKSFQLKTP